MARIRHIAILTEDVEKLVKFYMEGFGLKIVHGVGTATYLFALAALGILLATIANTMPQFALLSMPVFLILTMLSGSTSPLESMPIFLQTVLLASPSVHYVKATHAVLYRGAGLEIIWPHLLVLSGLGALFLAVALSRFRAMLARHA